MRGHILHTGPPSAPGLLIGPTMDSYNIAHALNEQIDSVNHIHMLQKKI